MADTLPPPPVGGGTKYVPHSAGVHPMICVDVIDLGLKPDQYQGGPLKLKHYIALVFASGERNEDGELVTVQQEFTYSMHENAKLRAFVQQWRGKPYASDAEAAALRLDAMEGAAGLVNVAHKTSKQGREYAVIVSISPLVKGMAKPVVEGYTRPAFWQTRKEEYARLAAPHLAPKSGSEHDLSDFPQALDGEDDDLPFDERG